MNGRSNIGVAFVFLFLSLFLQATSTKATIVEVEIQNFSFDPPSVTITAGDTLKWINKTSTFHTTTSGTSCTSNGIWDANLPSLDSSFSFVFSSAGVFPYFCRPHCGLGMTGTVTVEEDPSPIEESTWGQIKALYK